MNSLTRGVIVLSILIASAIGVWYLTLSTPTSDSAQGSRSTQGAGAAGAGRRGGGKPAPLVVASAVSEKLVDNRLKSVGNGAAQASVSVVPLSGGILTEVLVSAGQQVEVDDVLARLDSEEQQIARDRAARAAEEARKDATRLQRLYRSQTITEVELNRALAENNDAQLALRDAELTLKRRTITAPMAGIVGFVALDTGNYISAQTQLLTIDNRSNLIVEFWIPERFANKISIGQNIEAAALASPGAPKEGVITGIGSRIEPDSRTLQVKALIENTDDRFRPGMSFDLEMTFPGETYPAVNPLAIQWNSEGSYIWQLEEDKVKRVPARIIQRNPESVLVDADVGLGDQVISEGLLTLREGATVRVEGAQASSPSASQGAVKGAAQKAQGNGANGS